MQILLVFCFVALVNARLFSMNQHVEMRLHVHRSLAGFLPKSTDMYYFEILKKEQREEVTHFLLENFGKYEPLSKAANITSKEILVSLNMGLDRAFKNEISIIARSRATHEIIGCKINSVWRRNDVEETTDQKDFEFEAVRKEVQTLGDLLNELHEKFWETQTDIDTVIHAEIASVNKNYWRKGIATKFMEFTENEHVLKSVSAFGVVGEVTSFGNQKLLEKRNYKTLYKIALDSKKDENGKQVLVCDDGTTEVKLMFKKILDRSYRSHQ